MIIGLLALLVLGLTPVIGITFVRVNEQRRQRMDLIAYRLCFPRDLEKESVARALAGFSGLLLPWW